MSIAELDYDHRVFEQREANKQLAVRFFTEPVKNEEKSKAEGRPIFEDVEFIEKRVRGDRNNIVQRPVREDDKAEFREAYKSFKANEETPVEGTPLKEWPSITRSLLEELKHMGFLTVEQLASASDSVCSKFAGLQTYKQKAIVYLEYAKGNAPLEKYMGELHEMRNLLETLKKQTEEQAATIKALRNEKKEK
jgi:hypothetical protein